MATRSLVLSDVGAVEFDMNMLFISPKTPALIDGAKTQSAALKSEAAAVLIIFMLVTCTVFRELGTPGRGRFLAWLRQGLGLASQPNWPRHGAKR